MAATLYDTKTGAVVTTIGSRPTGGNQYSRTTEQFNTQTGNLLTTVAPSQPKGANFGDQSQANRPGAGQQAQTVGNLATNLAAVGGTPNLIGDNRAGVVAVLLPSTLAQRTATSFGQELYTKYENLFFANQNDKLSESLTVVKNNYASDLAVFRSKYTDRDESLIPDAVDVTIKSLITRAQQGTPLAPQPLFGFIPLKVSGLVQGITNLVLIAASAGAATWANASAGATTSANVGTSVAGGKVATVGLGSNLGGGFVADLGIRGAQAVNLAGAGATPGATIGLTGLQATSYSIGAAGGLVPVAPAVTAVNPTALRLGVVTTPIKTTLLDRFVEATKTKAVEVKDAALKNPVKSSLSAAGSALTIKQLAESENPWTGLVNTVSGALGLGPIIPNPKPGPSSTPPGLFQPLPESGSGGGGGGGGSYGGSTIFESGSLFPIMGILAATGLLAVFLIRR